jgi:hypothetical protein
MISAQTLPRLSRGKTGIHFSGSCLRSSRWEGPLSSMGVVDRMRLLRPWALLPHRSPSGGFPVVLRTIRSSFHSTKTPKGFLKKKEWLDQNQGCRSTTGLQERVRHERVQDLSDPGPNHRGGGGRPVDPLALAGAAEGVRSTERRGYRVRLNPCGFFSI